MRTTFLLFTPKYVTFVKMRSHFAEEEMNFELEGIHTETGPGVIEACIQADNGLDAIDKADILSVPEQSSSPRTSE